MSGSNALRCLAGALLMLGLIPGGISSARADPPDPRLRAALKRAIESSDSFANRFDAEVWLLDMSHRLRDRIPDPEQRLHLLRLVHSEARRAGLKPEWVLALIDVESHFNRFAISTAGARGLMQIMPFWLEAIGHPQDNLFHIQTNLRLGCTILRYYLDQEHGDLTRALARYNGSLGSDHYPILVFKALETQWFAQ